MPGVDTPVAAFARMIAAPVRALRGADGRRRLFLAYCLLVLVVHAWSIPRLALPGFPVWGPGDFTIFYTAAHIVRNGDAPRLYDLGLQAQVQQAFVLPHGWSFADGLLPYNYPPFVAILFIPLTFLPLAAAFDIWNLINIGLTLASIWLLLDGVQARSGSRFAAAAVVVFSFLPVLEALFKGQSVFLVVFALSVAYVSLQRGQKNLAGMAMGLGLVKPQLIVLPAALVLARGGRRTAWAFGLTAVVLAFVSWLLVGTDGAISYARLIGEMGAWDNHYQIRPATMVNLRGTTYRLEDLLRAGSGTGLPPELAPGIILLLSLGIVALVVDTWRRCGSARPPAFHFQFAQAVAGTLLLSPHLYGHDLTVLVVAGFAVIVYGDQADKAGLARGVIASGHVLLMLAALATTQLPVDLLTGYQVRAQVSVLALVFFMWQLWREAGRRQDPRQGPLAR